MVGWEDTSLGTTEPGSLPASGVSQLEGVIPSCVLVLQERAGDKVAQSFLALTQWTHNSWDSIIQISLSLD